METTLRAVMRAGETRSGGQMNIILVSDRLASTRSFSFGKIELLLLVVALFGAAYGLGAWMHRGEATAPAPAPIAASDPTARAQQRQTALAGLNGLAAKLGELQARLRQLDAFSERLAGHVGVKPVEAPKTATGGKGGPLVLARVGAQTVASVERQVQELSRLVDDRARRLELLDQWVRTDRVERSVLPTTMPVTEGYASSNFGYRADPFTGALALHQGMDFVAEAGTDVYAAAGGIVVASELNADYGNMVEIDHGNGLTTRYAHASRRLAKVGDIVLKGQKIAEVGSTGRSTGAHLHFEVRDKGVAINPAQFLKLAG
jgi:murein DD-endopeptidase MepM/ murein hydrolase activator NlpD